MGKTTPNNAIRKPTEPEILVFNLADNHCLSELIVMVRALRPAYVSIIVMHGTVAFEWAANFPMGK